MKVTYEALRADPGLVERMLIEAHRERSRAVHRLLIAPLVALFKQRPPRHTRMPRRSAFG